jgi:pyruvate dehydrogenase E1 component alpha subunit
MAVANQVERRPPSKLPPQTTSEGDAIPVDPAREIGMLRMMMLIRRFEERTFQEYTKPGQKIGGFCHLYSGQEAIAVGAAAIFQKSRDKLINGYRCHGHSLALGMSPRSAMAELFGRATGCSKGKGGSMHLFQIEEGNYGGHGIVGAQLPLAVGMAFAQKYQKTGGVTFCFMGDGALNQGAFGESMNLSSLQKLPVIFVVENNGVAMGTQVERHSADPELWKRGSGFAMPHRGIDGNDIDVVIAEFSKAVDRARGGEGPSFLVANTFRFRGHSMSDAMKYRTKEEAERAKLRDPIGLLSARLIERGVLTADRIDEMSHELQTEIDQATAQADADPNPELADRFNDVLSESYPYFP